MNSFVKKYAGIALASTVVIGGIASAAITPIPTISNTFAVAGQKILFADINKLAEALNVLDARTIKTEPYLLVDITPVSVPHSGNISTELGTFTIASGQEGIVNVQCNVGFGILTNQFVAGDLLLNGVIQATENHHDVSYGRASVGTSLQVAVGDIVSCNTTQMDSDSAARIPTNYRFTVQR